MHRRSQAVEQAGRGSDQSDNPDLPDEVCRKPCSERRRRVAAGERQRTVEHLADRHAVGQPEHQRQRRTPARVRADHRLQRGHDDCRRRHGRAHRHRARRECGPGRDRHRGRCRFACEQRHHTRSSRAARVHRYEADRKQHDIPVVQQGSRTPSNEMTEGLGRGWVEADPLGDVRTLERPGDSR